MPITPGQIYARYDRAEHAYHRIRITAYMPGDARAHVVDADSGLRFRQILVTQLHDSPTTRDGKTRRTGYALETNR